MSKDIKNICHYNTSAEKRFFLGREHRDSCDLIGLNGNIVSHAPAGVASFLATANKEFYIDPQTHAFQHATIHLKRNVSEKKEGEPPKYEFKPSIIKLAVERLGGLFASVINEDKPIRPSSFMDPSSGRIRMNVVTEVSRSVVDFQLNTMLGSLDEEEKEFLGDADRFKPAFVVAPYFLLTMIHFDQWLQIVCECYKQARRMDTDLPVFLPVVITRDALEKKRQFLVDNIRMIKPDGILLWIDDHVEENLSEYDVRVYVGFLKALADVTKVMYNIHGGYLSTLLCHDDLGSPLKGVGHSVNYGENRSVVPVGGGIPMARFYFPSIHSRLRFGDALGIVHAEEWLRSADVYTQHVCSCRQCIDLLDSMTPDEAFGVYGDSNPVTFARRTGSIVTLEYPTKEAKQAASSHYLYNKRKEFDVISEKPVVDLLDNLEAAYKRHGDRIVVDHLKSWQVLRDIMRS